ncbi:plasmid replication protein RepC [Sphingobium yanoikuyae]|uniref:plasmid replication protein RepC n=1 Tax=Sphingobium yanoikuyae TaxID=13690 RepID=UPI00084741CF|nr:plasmid replication protein RepC [Sphingobium yanoikuyae]
MLSVPQPGAGYRRYDAHFAAAESTAQQFSGLSGRKKHSHALAAFKRAAPHIGAGARIVHLIDLLFAWTRPQDWEPGRQPLVWPSNERLAEEMGIEVRQVQNLLRRAIVLRLIVPKDSPNGHRGGVRGDDGHIKWGYGFDLRPIGARMMEFTEIAEHAAAVRRERQELRRRLTIARKTVAQLAQTALEQDLTGCNWLEEVETARMIADHARGVQELDDLARLVNQLELRKRRVHAAFIGAATASERNEEAQKTVDVRMDITPTDEENCTHYTTTTDLQPAKAEIRNEPSRGSSREDRSSTSASSKVEEELEKYGIDVEFIGKACAPICWELDLGTRTWHDLIAIAERQAAFHFINDNTWREACRIMGRRGATAAMIAIAQKESEGQVQNPGGYLRAMTQRAVIGELHLGRTFHGLREAATIQ